MSATKVFISYRHEDSVHAAHRLYEELKRCFEEKTIFVDQRLPLGSRFPEAVRTALREAELMLVVIGRNWASEVDVSGQRQLSPGDWIREEIEFALRHEKTIIPVLVDGAVMPRRERLLDSLRPLADCTAMRLHNDQFSQGVQRIVQAIPGSLNYWGTPTPADPLDAIGSYPTPDVPLASDALREALLESLGGLPDVVSSDDDAQIRWLTNFHADRQPWVADQIERAQRRIRLICYSFEGWKDHVEPAIRRFLRRGGQFKLLMLDPASTGFREKTALEAFKYAVDAIPTLQSELHDAPTSSTTRAQKLATATATPEFLEQWRGGTESIRRAHRTAIASSVRTLELWKGMNPDVIEYGFYHDTPNMYGWSFDDQSMYLSSYFVGPAERGHMLPAICIDDVRASPWTQLLWRIYSNWFSVKLAGSRGLPT